jgi:hypothetical protein
VAAFDRYTGASAASTFSVAAGEESELDCSEASSGAREPLGGKLKGVPTCTLLAITDPNSCPDSATAASAFFLYLSLFSSFFAPRLCLPRLLCL